MLTEFNFETSSADIFSLSESNSDNAIDHWNLVQKLVTPKADSKPAVREASGGTPTNVGSVGSQGELGRTDALDALADDPLRRIRPASPAPLPNKTNSERRQSLRFRSERAFAGVITGQDGYRFEARLHDKKGQPFECEFQLTELPPAQRHKAQVGSLVNVLAGYMLVGQTERAGLKIYLSIDDKPTAIKERVVSKVISRWSFL
ncbi:hypothetical protein NKJ93_04820 [Mesorhizobium sp. M0028]|uniref:hypothetical protein n=1 Tax=Mesorhizobium sp. M0028 TaxID=2956849 RepID=UPI00333B06FF